MSTNNIVEPPHPSQDLVKGGGKVDSVWHKWFSRLWLELTKLLPALGTANQVLGVNAGATANEYKTLTGTSNRITITHAAGSVTFTTPQDTHTAASPTFAGLTDSGLTAKALVYADTNKLLSSLGLMNGQLAIGSTGNIPVAAALTPGAGISITNGAGSITIASTITAGASRAYAARH